eukprot:scaffold2107_cov192-Alexandrium_tamarense.AAC.54
MRGTQQSPKGGVFGENCGPLTFFGWGTKKLKYTHFPLTGVVSTREDRHSVDCSVSDDYLLNSFHKQINPIFQHSNNLYLTTIVDVGMARASSRSIQC